MDGFELAKRSGLFSSDNPDKSSLEHSFLQSSTPTSCPSVTLQRIMQCPSERQFAGPHLKVSGLARAEVTGLGDNRSTVSNKSRQRHVSIHGVIRHHSRLPRGLTPLRELDEGGTSPLSGTRAL